MSLDDIIKTAKAIVQSAKTLAYAIPIVALASCTPYIRDLAPKQLTTTNPEETAASTVSSENYKLQLSIAEGPDPTQTTPPSPDYASMPPEKSLALYLANNRIPVPKDDKIMYTDIFRLGNAYIIATYYTTSEDKTSIPDGSSLELVLYSLDHPAHTETITDYGVDGIHPCEQDTLEIRDESGFRIGIKRGETLIIREGSESTTTFTSMLGFSANYCARIILATRSTVTQILDLLGIEYTPTSLVLPSEPEEQDPELELDEADQHELVPLHPTGR